MKILMNRSRAKKLQKLITSKNKYICALLYIAGVIGIALFADLRVNQNTFVSENALLPGYVVTKYQQQSVAATLNREFLLLKDRTERHDWIIDQFLGLGLEVYTQNFTVQQPIKGTKVSGDNIYAIYRAPKVASTEALVFSTTLKDVQYAVPLMISLCHLISKQTIWAKDVIFLVSEQEEYGIGAWLQSYHDINTLPYISASPILTHSGAIQAALHLDMPEHLFDRLRMYVEAINGQLPDIDLVVLVRQICRQERIELLLRNAPHDIGDFTGNLLGLHANMAWQAAGRVSFPSALYHPYNIHAVGVQTERTSTTRNRFSWQHIGRFTESVLRSVNNLEEQFHTAYYFYLLPCIERFVCLSVYMIPCGLLLASTAAKVLCLWFQCGSKSEVTGAKMFFSDIDVNTIDCVYPFIHGIIFGVINEVATTFFTQNNILYLLGASQMVVVISALFTKQRSDWRLHQAFVLLLHVLTMVLLCMLNISLTLFYAIPTSLVYLLQFPSNKIVRSLQRVLLLAVNPLCLVVLYSYLYVYLQLHQYKGSVLGPLLDHATSVIESKYTLGVWTWNAYSYLLLPVWALQWTLHLPLGSDVVYLPSEEAEESMSDEVVKSDIEEVESESEKEVKEVEEPGKEKTE